MTTTWDHSLYHVFGTERTRPAADLLARVPFGRWERIVDLGCGGGNSTELLCSRFPKADILGVDSSEHMLAAMDGLKLNARWEQADFDTWSPESPPNLIFSNAAFQWSGDPVKLVTRLFALLAPGGGLAFQVPQNFDQPSHTQVRAAVEGGPWSEKLKSARQYDPGFAKGGDYARALMPLGAALDIWSTEYLHILSGADPVFRWMSGTGLRPFVQALEGEERAHFEAAARTRLAAAYPPERDGRTLFPFRRLFVIATRP